MVSTFGVQVRRSFRFFFKFQEKADPGRYSTNGSRVSTIAQRRINWELPVARGLHGAFGVFRSFSEFFGSFGIFSVVSLRSVVSKFILVCLQLQTCLNSLLIDVLEDAQRGAVVAEVADQVDAVLAVLDAGVAEEGILILLKLKD